MASLPKPNLTKLNTITNNQKHNSPNYKNNLNYNNNITTNNNPVVAITILITVPILSILTKKVFEFSQFNT